MHTTEYYFESHITIEPVFDDRLILASTIAKEYGFKIADLLMKKRIEDTEKRSQYDTFMSSRDKSYDILNNRMLDLILKLKELGFVIWRYKIENILCDSKYKDIHNLCH